MDVSTKDLYPVVQDLTEAEYGCCGSSEMIFGNFSIQDLAIPITKPRPMTSPDRKSRAEKQKGSLSLSSVERSNSILDDKEDSSERDTSKSEKRVVEFEDNFVLTRQVFRCRVSTVWECVRRDSGNRNCVKVIDRRRFSHNQDESNTLNEISIMSFLKQHVSSECVANPIQITQDLHRFYIVMNFIQGGNLATLLLQQGSLAEDQVQSLARSLVESVAAIHNLGVGHFNLEPENILLKPGLEACLCDFGKAAHIKEEKTGRRRHGNLAYAAPEDILKKSCLASDMWSIGVVLFHCFCGHLPFDDSSSKELKEKIFGHKYDFSATEWTFVSRSAKQFLSSLLHPDSQIRMTAAEALEHPWLSSPQPMMPAKRRKRMGIWGRLKRRPHKSSVNLRTPFGSVE